MRRRKDSHKARDLALQRMERLFVLAGAVHAAHPERSDRYVQIARKICTRTRVRMPRPLKRLFCRHCGSFLYRSSDEGEASRRRPDHHLPIMRRADEATLPVRK